MAISFRFFLVSILFCGMVFAQMETHEHSESGAPSGVRSVEQSGDRVRWRSFRGQPTRESAPRKTPAKYCTKLAMAEGVKLSKHRGGKAVYVGGEYIGCLTGEGDLQTLSDPSERMEAVCKSDSPFDSIGEPQGQTPPEKNNFTKPSDFGPSFDSKSPPSNE